MSEEVAINPAIAPIDLTQNSDELLKLTQKLRIQYINSTLNDISDPKTAKAMLTAAKDIDSQILTIKRIDADNNNSEEDRQMALRLNRQTVELARLTGNDPFRRQDLNNKVPNSEGVLKELPNITVVPGQTEQGQTNETYADFMDRMEDESNVPYSDDEEE